MLTNTRFIFLAFLFNLNICLSQCLSGDCINGKGKYDFGWCMYEGEFKDGKMEGMGTIDYGGGEKYTGQFSAGKENGKGMYYYSDGRSENVEYVNGTKVRIPTTVDMKPAPADTSCIEGDCVNGIGTYVFKSGNKYEGQWRNCKREGWGRVTFSNGDVYEGDFFDNEFHGKGTYYFNNGTKYEGEYVNGKEMNGYYTSPSGGWAEISGGQLVEKPQPQIIYSNGAQAQEKKRGNCPKCFGHGQRFKMAVYDYTNVTYTTNYNDGNGRSWSEYKGSGTRQVTTQEAGFYPCPMCLGTGNIDKKE